MPFNRIKRPIAGTVLVTFLAMVLQPLSVLAQDRPPAAASRRAAESGEEKFSRTLNEIHEILKEVAPQAAMPHMFPRKKGDTELRAIGPNMKIEVEPAKPRAGVDVAAKVSQLRAKAKELASLEEHVRAGFDETARHIKDKNLPAEIVARHEEALKAYEARAAEFKALVGAVDRSAAAGGAPLQSALNDLAAFMAKYPNQKTHTPTDPNNLPWGSPKPVTRAPYTSPSQFKTSRLFGEPVKVAQAGSLSGISLPNTALPVTPMPADTAPTEDVQITQPIRDLAASLGNKPVPIYNWVRNNIQFIPSYGSIQGSDMTLQTKRGNAFDTASLLIALLRAANIPARYVYGTIEVPADKAMNWVGGVNVPQAAMNLMGQGGIPNIGVGSGGQIRSIRLEHVWVEAFVDYVPSRGAVNRTPNTWVPMDASFKQYQFSKGMDIRSNFPVDAQALFTQSLQGATVSSGQGWVQNMNQAVIQQSLNSYQDQLLSYINSQKANATKSDVLGTQSIITATPGILYGSLPYKLLVSGARFQTIPENLRWKFSYSLYSSDEARALDAPFARLERSTVALAGRKITLSYSPATQADATTLNSFLPSAHQDGSPIQPSEFPKNLPGYLIHLTPELRIDGDVFATGPATTMGSELIQRAAYLNPATGQWEAGEDNRPVAGEYVATGLDLQGISGTQAGILRARLESTQSRLQPFIQNRDTSTLSGLTKEDLTGDLLYGAIFAYFAAIDVSAAATAKIFGAVSYRMPSFGNFGIGSRVSLFFGVPRLVGFPAFQMDVDRVSAIDVTNDGQPAALAGFRRVVGQQFSANEHLIPEQVFSLGDSGAVTPAVSAVKALGVASSLGQKIYTLSQSNSAIHDAALAQLNIDSSIREEIANNLALGKEVTVHEAPVNVAGYLAVGYIIVDPDTGAGAYKISGGANGGGQRNDVPALAEALLGLIIPSANASTTLLGELAAGTYKGFGLMAALNRSVDECANASDLENRLWASTVFGQLLAMAIIATVFIAGGIAIAAAPWTFLIVSVLLGLFIGYFLEEITFNWYCRPLPK